MSFNEPNALESRVSPGLTLNLSSNNPFRNRAGTPSQLSPSSPAFNINSVPPERPISRNPFLDYTEKPEATSRQQQPLSPTSRAMPVVNRTSSPTKPAPSATTIDLFNNLNINDNATSNGGPPQTAASKTINRPLRTENMPPPAYTSVGTHRTSRSRDEELERLRNGGKPRKSNTLDIFADPPAAGKAREQRRPRRNSESSVAERPRNSLDTDEEHKRKERRHREREVRQRERDGKGRVPPSSARSKKPNHRLDIIDKLDVTSIYGTGLFHHDGPFDACNPHRNRKGSQRAPMQAFPKDSANNVLGGSGPVNKNIDIAQFHGVGAEGFTDYSTSRTTNSTASPVSFEPYAGAGAPYRGDARPGVDRTSSFNATSKVDIVHGDESMGLGTSTFLEGAPAPRVAIQRRESESEGQGLTGGLGRKQSLAQKIRGIKNNAGPRIMSPEPNFERATSPTEVQSAGGLSKIRESNPFFNDYNDAYDKKGAKILVAEEQNREGPLSPTARARAPSSPMRNPGPASSLERRVTNDGTNGKPGAESGGDGVDTGKSGGGFLSRVKSLRGGRRARPERKE